MPVNYKIVKQCQPGVKGGGNGKFYARACERKKISLVDLCNIIQKRTSFSNADVTGVITAFTDLIPELLAEGQTLELGQMGLFSLSLKSRGESAHDKVSRYSITGAQINFRPGVGMKRALKNIDFVKKRG